MTINYSNGTALEALVLSHDDHEIRAIAPGGEDALAFTRVHGTWISKELEPVTISFEWQRRVEVQFPPLTIAFALRNWRHT